MDMDELFVYRLWECLFFFVAIIGLTVCVAYCCPMVLSDSDLCCGSKEKKKRVSIVNLPRFSFVKRISRRSSSKVDIEQNL